MRNLTFSGLRLVICLCVGLLGCFAVMPSMARAEGIVSCKYLKAEGRNIELQLEVTGPAPVTIIVLQYLPAGVKILNSKPAMKKYNHKKGVAKWLLKNVRPGKMRVRMKFDKALKPGKIKGELRYRVPGSGTMESMLINS